MTADEVRKGAKQSLMLWLGFLIVCLLVLVLIGFLSGFFTKSRAFLAQWMIIDTWTVVIAGLAAMGCAIPGCFLVVRRQSMMGDALSHTALPGVVIAFLLAAWLRKWGYISNETYHSTAHTTLFLGALIIGVLTAVITELVQKLGRVESSASLGVVFTSLFALGLLLIRLFVDDIHLDPDCVLYGQLELTALTNQRIPPAAFNSAVVLIINLVLVVVFFKELKISAFDPALATTMGINSHLMHYALMGITAATVVSAFESVGSILVIAMLIAPAATAYLLTDRLSLMIVLSMVIAVACAVLGHLFAMTIPAMVFQPLGFTAVADASTSGTIAATSGFLFLLALLLGPRHGLISKLLERTRLQLGHSKNELLCLLLRLEQLGRERVTVAEARAFLCQISGSSFWFASLTVRQAVWAGQVETSGKALRLTDSGRQFAGQHSFDSPIWEAAIDKHFSVAQ